MDVTHSEIYHKVDGQKQRLIFRDMAQKEVSDITAPHTVDIAIQDAGRLIRGATDVLKKQAGTSGSITADFTAEDATKYTVDGVNADQSPYVAFDGVMKPITEYDIPVSEPVALDGGMTCETGVISSETYKKIEDISIRLLSDGSGSLVCVKQVAVGDGSSFFLLNDGTVMASGGNSYGQLGLGVKKDSSSLTLIPDLKNVKKVACSGWHTAFLLNDGTVKTCGSYSSDQLGLGVNVQALTPTLIPDLTRVKDIENGHRVTFFLMEDGTVKGCGCNYNGALGYGGKANWPKPTNIGIRNVKKIVCGAEHTLFLLNDGTVMASGYNLKGELGLGDTTVRNYPEIIPNLTNVKDVSAGDSHTVFLLEDGTIKSCGYNNRGQLGLGDTTDRTIPTLSKIVSNVRRIVAFRMYNKTFFLLNDGSAWMGNNPTYLTYSTGEKIDLTNVKEFLFGSGNNHILLMNDKRVCGSDEYGRYSFYSQFPAEQQFYYLYLTGDQAYVGPVLDTSVSNDFTLLSDAEKKSLFLSAQTVMASTNEITKLNAPKIAIYTDKATMNKPTCTLTAIPQKIVLFKNLFTVGAITKATVTSNTTGSSTVKIVVTTNGDTYKTLANGVWETVDHTDPVAIAADGIDSAAIASITASQWSDLLNGATSIGFAYLLDMDKTSDTCEVNQLDLQIESIPRWLMALPGTDYTYEYPDNTTLRVSLLTDGSYKINYPI